LFHSYSLEGLTEDSVAALAIDLNIPTVVYGLTDNEKERAIATLK